MNGIRHLPTWRRAAMGYAALIACLSFCQLAAVRLLGPTSGAYIERLTDEALPVFGILGALTLLLSPAVAGGLLRGLRQVRWGMGRLPDYGHNTGTYLLVALTGAGAFAGARGGLEGAIVGAAVVLLPMGALYAWGAYDRAEGHHRRGR